MRFQSRKFTCGPAALANALEVYGDYRSEDELAILCKTDPIEGTSARHLVNGALGLGYTLHPLKFRDATLARVELEACAAAGFPCILSVDDWKHWITVAGSCGNKAVVIDSASQHLVSFPEWSELMLRWKYPGSRYEGYKVTHVFVSV